ncbi:MAG: YceI family protein [Bacteroidetes bacterium]|nr:YceI family protein [Bacteroidota bacterium]
MKKTLLGIFMSAIIVSSFAFNYITNYSIDIEQSELTWAGKKIAYGHSGSLNLAKGTLMVANGKLTGGNFEMDMTSMVNTDIEDESRKTRLMGHLKSEDFFNVAQFPTSTVSITSVKSQKSENGNYEITADLTIKGTTHPVTFPANVVIKGDKIIAEASIVFDRSKYDVRYGSGSFFDDLGDKVIYDDIEIGVKLIANK